MRNFNGRALGTREIVALEHRLGVHLPTELAQILTTAQLAGAEFSLDPTEDASGLGVALRWMTPQEMVSEATDVFPGKVAAPLGFIPVGICLEGSGDPYFVRLCDLALVRIPHEATRGGVLVEASVESVADSVKDFLERAVSS